MKKNQWIDEVVSSIKGMKRAKPDSLLYTQIQNKLRTEARTLFIPKFKVGITFAGFIILCLLNLYVIFSSSDKSENIVKTKSTIDFFPQQLY